MNIDSINADFPRLLNMPSIYPNGAYCKRVFMIPDMDITPFYEAWIINTMNRYLANGELPTCMPVLVISSNNWTKGGTVVWNNGFVDPSGKYVIESVGSHYSPYENKFSFTDSFGLPALYPKINDVGRTEGYGWTMEEIRQAQIAAGIIPDDTKPETPDTDIVFTDVDSSAYYAEAVNWAAKNGITTRIGSNKFDPNGSVTRAQAVTFLYRAAGEPAVNASNDFTDVPTDEWYSDPVAWAVANGITNGTGGGKFSPDDPVTYAQMLAFIARSVKATLPADMAWDDAPMAWARSANMFAGMPHSPIKGNPASRADVVHFLNQYYK